MKTSATNPGIGTAFLLLAAMDFAMRTRGLPGGLKLANRLARSSPRRTTPDGTVMRATRAVTMAAAFYPRRALCLEQSLVLYVLLRRRGIPADLKVGVQTLPFAAHAWVEVDGIAVNEPQGLIEQLVTFQQVSA